MQSWIDPFYGLLGLLGKTWLGVGWMQVGLMFFFLIIGWLLAQQSGGAFWSVRVLVTLLPSLLGVMWLVLWAGHTNHTFVNVLPATMLLNLVFTLELARQLNSQTLIPQGHEAPSSL